MEKRILVTGNAGFLGGHLVDNLIAEGYTVYGIDNLSTGSIENVNKDCTFYKGDINNKELVESIFKHGKIDIVYHFAADASESKSVFNPRYSAQNNLIGALNIIEEFVNHQGERFVFMSSIARYGKQDPPFTEDTPAKPHDPYGWNKYVFEEKLRLLADIHGFEWNIAVAHNVYGPRQSMRDPNRNAIAVFINRSLQKIPHIIYGDGESVRSFTYVDDAIGPLMKLGLDPNIKYEVVNIGPDEPETMITVNELSKTINQILGVNIKPVYTPFRPRDIKIVYANSDKARKLLGYKTTVTLKDGLRKTIEWAKTIGPQPFIHETEHGIKRNLPEAWLKKH